MARFMDGLFWRYFCDHIRPIPQPTSAYVGIRVAWLDSLFTCWASGQPSTNIPYSLLSESSSPQRERSHERLFNHMNATFLTLLTEHIAEILILMFPLGCLYNCNCAYSVSSFTNRSLPVVLYDWLKIKVHSMGTKNPTHCSRHLFTHFVYKVHH